MGMSGIVGHDRRRARTSLKSVPIASHALVVLERFGVDGAAAVCVLGRRGKKDAGRQEGEWRGSFSNSTWTFLSIEEPRTV